jgi:hypothetical protein
MFNSSEYLNLNIYGSFISYIVPIFRQFCKAQVSTDSQHSV